MVYYLGLLKANKTGFNSDLMAYLISGHNVSSQRGSAMPFIDQVKTTHGSYIARGSPDLRRSQGGDTMKGPTDKDSLDHWGPAAKDFLEETFRNKSKYTEFKSGEPVSAKKEKGKAGEPASSTAGGRKKQTIAQYINAAMDQAQRHPFRIHALLASLDEERYKLIIDLLDWWDELGTKIFGPLDAPFDEPNLDEVPACWKVFLHYLIFDLTS
jgi:hypothetical protein